MSYTEEAAEIAAAVAGLPVKVRRWTPDPQNPERRRFAGWEPATVAGPAADSDAIAWGVTFGDGRNGSVQWSDVMFPPESFEEAARRLPSRTA
ncbi:hypothetical protein [Streptomyces subrutilus]|uniref:Uncharacterized protein n=1 Tax=Streptomyces subrutilus TaxID=36818 RepID=A0A1E5NXE0_9ACTN|nr:hypothetical protein [Streptomyces subrutilus]OEJ20911.1 hypothetical protein BGK67_35340 [Streptomyces subrutilus]